MDANGTRYHQLLGCNDWAHCRDENDQLLRQTWGPEPSDPVLLHWDLERHELTLAPRLFIYVAAPGDQQPSGPQDRRGAARDRYGNWYWIDAARRKIRVFSAGSGLVTDFWPEDGSPPEAPAPDAVFRPQSPPATPAALAFAGLAVTEDHYLVVGVSDPPGLLVFDLFGGGPPTQYFWPAHVPFAPFDMAPMPGGGVWILDYEHKRYWALDRHFDVLAYDQTQPPATVEAAPETFQAVSLSTPDSRRMRPQAFFPAGIDLEPGMPSGNHDPIAIEALPDCTVLILYSRPGADFSEIARYRFGTRLGPPVSTAGMKTYVEAGRQAVFKLPGHDFAFVPAHATADGAELDRLYVSSTNGNQTFAFNIAGDDTHLQLTPRPEEYLPMRLFGGKALVAGGTQLYYDMGERWLPLIAQPRPRYEPRAVISRIFDGKQPGCIWHRLMLDACIPPDTQVQIWSRAANDERELRTAVWQVERLYRRGDGSEIPFERNPFRTTTISDETGQLQTAASRPGATGSGTWELLFQRANGRLLEIQIFLSGQEQRTPRLRELRVYYPRFSYLTHYLPAVYRADSESASFLERYLANAEGIYTAVEDKISNVRQLFDVASASPEALEWLAGWFGVVLDPGWDEYRRRLFIQHAMLFFQYRGTLRGLQMALRLALDACPGQHIFEDEGRGGQDGAIRIIEMFLARNLPALLLGDPTDLTPRAPVTNQAMWHPDDGRAVFEYHYQAATGATGSYPLRDPGSDQGRAWRAFSLENLGFIPASGPGDLMLWQAYLLHTYGAIEVYNQAYNLAGDQQLFSFDEAALPEALPVDGRPIDDWFRFETNFLPMVRYAHQFSVLLPMPAGAGPDSLVYQQRLSLAKKVVELEKPAHTTYNIKFYWAMFRVGAARLSLDTLLDLGGRSAQLFPPLVLGQTYLAQGALGEDHPPDLAGRLVLGRGARSGAARQVVIRNRPPSSGRAGCP